jgi:hypothetical protein
MIIITIHKLIIIATLHFNDPRLKKAIDNVIFFPINHFNIIDQEHIKGHGRDKKVEKDNLDITKVE